MSTLFVVNIVIELVCSVLCLIFVVCTLVGDGLKSKLNRVFISVLLSNAALMSSDALAFFSIGKTEPGIFFALNFIGNFFTFQLSYVIIMCFSYYIYIYFSTKAPVKKIWLHMALGICSLAIILTFISLFNNMYFIIDENNVYHRQDMYWLSQVLGMAGMLVNSIVIIMYRKHLNRMEKVALASYIVLPVIAIVIQMTVYGFVAVYIASTTSIVLIYIGMQVQYARTLKEKEMQLTESRVAVMLSQIQPHFLYNSLTAISDLCAENEEAQKALVTFSEYLRVNMNSLSQKQPILFETELHHVKQYLWLEQLRFEERLRVEYDIGVSGFMLPVLSVQPIVENAIHHGLLKKEGGGTITIRTEEDDNCYRVIVKDDGVGFNHDILPDDGRSHLGIENVRNRLAAMCCGTLDISSTPGVGTTAVIEIPKES